MTNMRTPMQYDRLTQLMQHLTNHTVLADLIAPVAFLLERIRGSDAVGRVLNMTDFIALGVLRHLQEIAILREQVQELLHLDPGSPERPPLARSTWSDALASSKRRDILRGVLARLREQAQDVLPNRLAKIPGVGERAVFAIDGTYQRESAHFRRRTPRQGGNDNPKGHALLTFYDIRLGVPVDALVQTRNRHEMALLNDYDATLDPLTQTRGALWIVDRAFVDAPFWDSQKRRLGSTMITRMKSNLAINATQGRPVADHEANEGVQRDLEVLLESSPQPWRLITYRTRRGKQIEFLTNDFTLEPGVVAFLYSRRWDEEKCFDTWKNDFTQAKAWGKSLVAIENQTMLALITSLLIAILLQPHLDEAGLGDEKVLKKQRKRQALPLDHPDATDRPDWTVDLYQYTAKISRQVLRLLKFLFLAPASPGFFQRQLRPLLLHYL